MTRAAFQGSYADLRFIRTRKVAAITVEIPLEQASAFIEAFGAPDPSAEIPVAIARLDLSAKAEEPKAIAPPEKRSWEDLRPSQQAGIRCNEVAFAKFMRTKFPTVIYPVSEGMTGADETASMLKAVLNIASRRELDTDQRAAQEWRKIEARFQVWMGRAT
jgi:hypothetical protein